jgi:hypothetical protein
MIVAEGGGKTKERGLATEAQTAQRKGGETKIQRRIARRMSRNECCGEHHARVGEKPQA